LLQVLRYQELIALNASATSSSIMGYQGRSPWLVSWDFRRLTQAPYKVSEFGAKALILSGTDIYPEAKPGTEHRKNCHPGIGPGRRAKCGKAVAEQ